MDYPPPFDILEMAFFAGADKTDWRYVAFAPIIENEPAPALGIEILPTHQSPASDGPGPGSDGLHLLANEPGWKHGSGDAPGNTMITIGRCGRVRSESLAP